MGTQRRSLVRSAVALFAAMLVGDRAWPAHAEPAPPVASAQLLDGRTYIGQVGEKGKSAGDEDTLRFAAGQFHSSACDRYGFGKGAYTSASKGESITFSAEIVSEKEGRMVWTGTVTSYKLDGTATWTKPGQPPIEYWVRAELTH